MNDPSIHTSHLRSLASRGKDKPPAAQEKHREVMPVAVDLKLAYLKVVTVPGADAHDSPKRCSGGQPGTGGMSPALRNHTRGKRRMSREEYEGNVWSTRF